jgi:hypothetical protein
VRKADEQGSVTIRDARGFQDLVITAPRANRDRLGAVPAITRQPPDTLDRRAVRQDETPARPHVERIEHAKRSMQLADRISARHAIPRAFAAANRWRSSVETWRSPSALSRASRRKVFAPRSALAGGQPWACIAMDHNSMSQASEGLTGAMAGRGLDGRVSVATPLPLGCPKPDFSVLLRPDARPPERAGKSWKLQEFDGDPGGIRTRDLDLERVASWARLDDGVGCALSIPDPVASSASPRGR